MSGLVKFPGFVGSAFGPQARSLDLQDLYNWYLEVAESPFAKTPTGLLPCPGFETFVTLPNTPVRGLWAQNDRVFAVADTILYEIFRTGTYTARAMTALATPTAPSITNSPLTPALDAPAQPVITHGGALGTTPYGYKVTAFNDLGETTGSVEGTSIYGNAALSSVNYNVVTWQPVTGASGYKVYRTTGTGSGVLVAVVQSDTTFVLDIGTAGTAATPPVSNTSGGVAGTTPYGYKIVATLGLGETAASAEGVTLTGQATLDEDNYNIITWPAVANAHRYKVYRTTGGSPTPPVLIGTTSELTLNDVGEEGESEIPSTTNTTATFALTNDGTPVSFCSSGDAGNQIQIVSGGSAFVFDLSTNTLGKVVDGATSGAYLGGYFLILDAATSTMKCSELLDGYAWDPTQIYQRTSAGDRWLAMDATATEVWLMGSDTGDIWKLTGNDDTRFAPYQDVTIDQGIIAPASFNRVSGSSFMWIGQNAKGGGIIWKSESYAAVQVSTRGIEKEMETYGTLADAYAFSYQQQGHHFYVVTFPTDEKTWVYDELTREWHRRGFWDPNAMAFSAYRPQCHAFAFGGVGFGRHLVGDRDSGVIATMSPDLAYDIDGTTLIRRLRQTPHLSKNQDRITIWALHVDLDVAEGTETGQGSDPTVALQISKDAGKTWGKILRRSAGRQGEYKTRVTFNRLGDARDWVFRFSVSDPIAWRIAGAYIQPNEEAA